MGNGQPRAQRIYWADLAEGMCLAVLTPRFSWIAGDVEMAECIEGAEDERPIFIIKINVDFESYTIDLSSDDLHMHLLAANFEIF